MMTTNDGHGRVDTFRIAHVNDDECSLRFKDDSVETFYHDGADIYFFTESGGGPVKVYLHRAE